MKRIIANLLLLTILITIVQPIGAQRADAAENYITVSAFAKALVNEMELETAEGSEASGYVNKLIEIGVIKDGDFSNYSWALKRGDMLVLLNRADDFLIKSKVDADLVNEVIEKRISDIKKVSEAKREDVAKGFVKGFLQGYSNGAYSSNRNLKVMDKIVKKDALNCIKKLTDKSLRAKISPDGQLIRTTNLPNNAYMFKYILDSFPNKYYEAKLRFEGVIRHRGGKLVKMKSPEDYTYPKDVAKAKDTGINDFNMVKENFLDTWMEKAYTRAWNTFNVNYKTIDNVWVETMAQTDSYIYEESKTVYDCLNAYVANMKKNKTIVKCDKVAIDRSSMYFYNGFYYIRCYVHYCIDSSLVKNTKFAYDYGDNYWGPYNSILFSRANDIELHGYSIKKWVDGIFDVGLCTGVYGNDGSMYGACDCDWSPDLFRVIERK